MNATVIRPDPDLPADLETAVRTTAAHVPELLPNLTGVRQRARTFRRRRAALRAAAAAVVVVALGAAVPALRSPSPVDTAAARSVPIGLWLNRDTLPVTRGLPPGHHVPGSSSDIAAQLRTVDGKATVTPIVRQPGYMFGSLMGPTPLPGGGLATIAGVWANAAHTVFRYRVLVVDANGRIVASRPMPHVDADPYRLMTGNSRSLYWWAFQTVGQTTRPVLATYDIATGTVREKVHGSGYEIPYFGIQATDDRIITWPAEFGRTCTADILNAASGEPVTRIRPAIANCSDVYFALSPDNRRVAALVTYRTATTWSQRVISIDAHTGAIQKVFQTPALATGTDRTRLLSGIDWLDRKTIRYARGVLPAPNQTGPDPVVLTLRP